MQSYTKNKASNIVLLGLFAAIVIIQSWVPLLGYVTIGPLSMTIIPITVILATLWFGTRNGVAIGGIFGINALLVAWVRGLPIERLIFTSPWVSILPRLLMPVLLGVIIDLFLKKLNPPLRAALAGLIGSLLNTILVLIAIGLFKPDEYLTAFEGATQSQLWPILMGLVTANGIPEALLAFIVTPIIYLAVNRARKTNI